MTNREREILRMASKNISQRSMASSLSCSRHYIAKVLLRAKELNLSWPLPADMSDPMLVALLFLVIPSQKEHCSELRSQAFRELRANHSEDREPSIPTSGSQGFRAKGACKGLQN